MKKCHFKLIFFVLLSTLNIQGTLLKADELRVQPNSIVFSAVQGKSVNETRSVFVFNSVDTSVISWSQVKNADWITASMQTGLTNSVLRIGVSTSGLLPGVYNGNVTLYSNQSEGDPVTVTVTLIINPDSPVTVSTWKDGYKGAMSVSVDDSQLSGFSELQANGFQGTFVSWEEQPPAEYTDLYNAGMELGSHTNNHPCFSVSDYRLRYWELEPNISGLCRYTPQPCKDVISFIWPCGYTNYREQAIASEYFLSARGYNFNQLEDANPENFMNLKSYNSHEHPPYPPSDLKNVVDAAIQQQKWFNLVLHRMTNDDGAINYANGKDIWVTSIGSVIKYIMQRQRFILTDVSLATDKITFKASRLRIPSSPLKNFEDAFGVNDLITTQIDIADDRLVEYVLIDGNQNPYAIRDFAGNKMLLLNLKLESEIIKTVEIKYFERSATIIHVSGITANNKIYNGTTAATINSGAATITGVIPGDDVYLISSSARGTFDNKNVGTSKVVHITGLILSGPDADKYTLIAPETRANITRANLNISGVTASNKTYDGSTTAVLNMNGASLTGIFGGDNVYLSSSSAVGTFDNKNAGTGKSIRTSGFTIIGSDAGNYTLIQPVSTADILRAQASVLGLRINNKVYDGNTIIPLNYGSAHLSGILGNDDVQLLAGGITASALNKNAGVRKVVNISGFSLGGADARNYSLLQPAGYADITPAPLELTGVTANSRVYNGLRSVTLNTQRASFTGMISGDNITPVSISATGLLENKNAGTEKIVTTAGFGVAGTDAVNYILTQPILTADITKASITVSGVTATDKVYDGTTKVTLNVNIAVLSGIMPGDVVNLDASAAVGTFSQSNVSALIPVTTSGFSITGPDSSNYTIVNPVIYASIIRRNLRVIANSISKHYNEEFIFSGTEFTTEGLIPGDPFPTVSMSSQGASALAAAGKYIINIAGTADGNYNPYFIQGTMTVGKALLIARADNKSRVYGSENPVFSVSYSGFLKSDDPTLIDIEPVATTSALSSSNAGEYPITLSGGSDDNYEFKFEEGILNIQKAPLTITADDKTKIYGEPNPELTVSCSGFVPGESESNLTRVPVAITASDIQSEAGNYYIYVSGAESPNYSFIYNHGNLEIKKADQMITFDDMSSQLRLNHKYSLNAKATSGLEVRFELTDNGQGTLKENILTVTKAGNLTIKAIQDGNNNWNPAPPESRNLAAVPSIDGIPSLFTPNNDGINDYWYIPFIEEYGVVSVVIVNRFGQTVYESYDYNNDWDGTWKGNQLPSASYYYLITSTLKGFTKGVVNIVR